MAKILITRKYGVPPNELLNNKNISLKAKGLYAYIQSKPDNWDFSVKKMSCQLKEGVDGITAAVKELEDNGYLMRKKYQNDKGFFDMDYYLFETPFNVHLSKEELIKSIEENQEMDSPNEEKPSSDFPVKENTHILVNKNIVKKNIVKNSSISNYITNTTTKVEKNEKYGLANDILNFFNEHCGKKSKLSPSNLKFLQARIKDGITLDEAIKVIKLKKWEWEGSDMEKYLQIQTLFNKEKCDKYLEQINDKSYMERIAKSKKSKPKLAQDGTTDLKDHDEIRKTYTQKQSF